MWPTHIVLGFLPFPPTPSKTENDCIFFKGHYCLLIMKVLTSALSPAFFRKVCSPLLFPNWSNSAKPSPCLLYFSACMLFLQKLIAPPRCLPGASVVKNPPANGGDSGLIPGSGKSLETEMATQSSILAWEIPWTEDLDGLQSMESQKSWT